MINDSPYKFVLVLLAILLFGGGSLSAQQDPLDAGGPDSVITSFTQPYLQDGQWSASIDIYLLNDAQTVGAASVGFSWDNLSVRIDSVLFSPEATAAFDLFRYAYYKNDVDSTNFHRLLQCTVIGHPSNGLAPSATPQLVATYFVTLSQWIPNESVCLSPDLFVGRSFIDPVLGEYSVGWRDPVCAESGPDGDGDGIGDNSDNCPGLANADQSDFDRDRTGDLCDACTDGDGDGYGDPGFAANLCAVDNCPEISNPGQEDADMDGIGDLCEVGCCNQRVGDANGSGEDEPTIGDISVIVDVLFITLDPTVVPCLTEADVNQSGGANPTLDDLTLGDASLLVDYLFITGSSLGLADCP